MKEKTGVACNNFEEDHVILLKDWNTLKQQIAASLKKKSVTQTELEEMRESFNSVKNFLAPHLTEEERTFTKQLIDEKFTKKEQEEAHKVISIFFPFFLIGKKDIIFLGYYSLLSCRL